MSTAASDFRFPKSARILRRSDFRKVYDNGKRHSTRFFSAFCLCESEQTAGPRVGFTVSRAMGKAVVRNRMKRKVREAVRLHLALLQPQWSIVFNPKKAVLDAPAPDIQREVERLFQRCVSC